jgi:hypothetical protein
MMVPAPKGQLTLPRHGDASRRDRRALDDAGSRLSVDEESVEHLIELANRRHLVAREELDCWKPIVPQ